MEKIKRTSLIFLFMIISYLPVFSQSTSQIIDELYNGATDLISQSKDLIYLSVQAVWLASEITGTATITGTLTQSASNPNYWTYSYNPNDKLVVAFANGYTISFAFSTINGYTEGDAEDFIDYHVMDFVSVDNGSINLRIQSQTGPNGDNVEWNRTITGTTEYGNITVTANVTTYGFKHTEVGGGFAFGDFYDEYSGTISNSTVDFNINERQTIHNGYNSNNQLYVHERHVHNNSSASGSFGSYNFQELYCFYVGATQSPDSANAGHYSNAIEVYNWVAQGALLKDGSSFGNVQFSSTPVEYTYGPKLVVSCQDGNTYNLDPLLNWYLTDVENEEVTEPENFILEQNYPNPFNPTTTISYSIPSVIARSEATRQSIGNSTPAKNTTDCRVNSNKLEFTRNDKTIQVSLKIYDALGREVATLVNKKQVAGKYSAQFDANSVSGGLPSGVYFYTLRAGNFIQTRKMILLK